MNPERTDFQLENPQIRSLEQNHFPTGIALSAEKAPCAQANFVSLYGKQEETELGMIILLEK